MARRVGSGGRQRRLRAQLLAAGRGRRPDRRGRPRLRRGHTGRIRWSVGSDDALPVHDTLAQTGVQLPESGDPAPLSGPPAAALHRCPRSTAPPRWRSGSRCSRWSLRSGTSRAQQAALLALPAPGSGLPETGVVGEAGRPATPARPQSPSPSPLKLIHWCSQPPQQLIRGYAAPQLIIESPRHAAPVAIITAAIRLDRAMLSSARECCASRLRSRPSLEISPEPHPPAIKPAKLMSAAVSLLVEKP